MKLLYQKYREIIVYLVVGIMTTIVSWGACFFAKLFLNSSNEFQNFIINTVGWVIGVVFAYPLSRKWVFKSNNENILKEFLNFAASRISTWILDVFIMWFFVNIIPLYKPINTICNYLGYILSYEKLDLLNYWVAKICISTTLVTIINYMISKVFIFKKKKSN